jgi:transglutaminase-like putative cysteine protease
VNRYRISHVTRYEYEALVVHAHHLAHLRPCGLDGQKLVSSDVKVEPAPVNTSRFADYFGNVCDEIEILRAHDLLEVTASSVVEVSGSDFDPRSAPATSWDELARRMRDDP